MTGTSADHYFSERPAVASDRRTVTLALPDVRLALRTDRGVFAADAVDPGTRLLLLESPPPPTGPEVELLDLGCGYGPIALTLGRRAPSARVWAIDVNERARALTAENAATCGVTNVVVAAPDDVPADVRFDAVYANPPIRIGKAALHEMLLQWLGRLRPDGEAHLVVHKHLGADSLQRWLRECGFDAERRASRLGYRILVVRPRAAAGAVPSDAANEGVEP